MLQTPKPCIETASGKKIYFLDPNPDDFDIEDIAFSLSNQCRFNGHVPFYSVAEHCLWVAAKLPTEHKLAGLLHDASEAYLSDVPTPVKQCLPDYKKIEANLQAAIDKKFNIDSQTEQVFFWDKKSVYREAFFLLKSKGKDWIPEGEDFTDARPPMCMPPNLAYKLFIDAYKTLTNTPNIFTFTSNGTYNQRNTQS
jgi:uncharacterized protein